MSANDPMPQERLDAIQERADNATTGPWVRWEGWDDADNSVSSDGREDAPTIADLITEKADAEFISRAREDVPALLAEVERLRDELAKAREVTEDKVEKGGVAANDVGWTCYGGAHEPGSYHECPECKKASDQLARCVLTAALGGGDDA